MIEDMNAEPAPFLRRVIIIVLSTLAGVAVAALAVVLS